MIRVISMQEPKVGSTYKFVYDNKKRVAMVIDDNGSNMECWDFTRGGWRNFKHDKITGSVEDVSKFVKTISNFDLSDIDRYEEAGCKVFERDDVLYVVNLA